MSKEKIEIGKPAPDFTLPADEGADFTLSKSKGKNILLFFYPKDDTPGCTAEACGFNDALPDFSKLNVSVYGISKCSLKKHKKFREKYGLAFPLLSDENNDLCERFGVWAEKSMYGKKYMGIERSTFLIDEKGIVRAIWRNVKVPGHVDEVRKELSGLAKAA